MDTAVANLRDEEIDNFPAEIGTALDLVNQRLRNKFRIPENVHLTTDEPVADDGLGWWMESIGGWVSGALSREHSTQLVKELDLQELDEYYIFLMCQTFPSQASNAHYLSKRL